MKKTTYKLLIIIVLFCFVGILSFGQDKISYEPSYDVLVRGEKFFNEKEYKLALEEYEKVYEGDSLFFRYAVFMKMAALNNLEEYKKVTEIGNKYWYFRHELPTEFYLNYGTALDKLKEYDKAQEMYKSILEEYPMNYSLWYNLGFSQYLEGDKKEAYATFQKTIEINPFYDRVHLLMADLAFSEQQTTKGLMAMGMYLMHSASKRNNFVELRNGDFKASAKYWTEDDFSGSNGLDLGGNASFATIDQFVHNYVALNDKYKTPSKLIFPLIKQLHLIATQLKEQGGDENDYWYQNYGKFYVELLNKNQFAGFSYLISAYVENEKIKSIITKNDKVMKEAYKWSYDYLSENSIEADLTFIGLGEKTKVNRNSKNHYISILGDFILKDNGQTIVGDVQFFGASGRMVSEGSFNQTGNKDGVWKYYNTNGRLKEQQFMKDGKLTDTSYFYQSNGLLSLKLPYKEDKIDGNVEVYHNGILLRTLPYKAGVFGTGDLVEYYPIGTIDTKYGVIDGKGNGSIEYFYDSGEPYRTGTIKAGDLQGERITYFRTGEVSYKENYLNNKSNGEYISYYQGGQVEAKGLFKEGNKIGTWEYYFQNGNKRKVQNFDEQGKQNGQETEFTKSGWKLSEHTFTKGFVDSYKFFNEKGEILSQGERKKGAVDYVGYYQNGVKSGEGSIGKFGREGEWKFYRYNGSLSKIENYKSGKLVGAREEFFPNGELEVSYKFNEEGNSEGYYQNNYRSKSLFNQGYLKQGEKDGPWILYYRNKVVKNTKFFSEEELQGFSTDYDFMGNPIMSTYYEDGINMFEIYYDTAGVAFDTVFQVPGRRTVSLKRCADCAVFMTVDVFNNQYHGNQVFLYPDGSVKSTGKVFNGYKEGLWKSFHPNGQLSSEGKYVSGDSEGEWRFYNEQGILIRISNYKNDDLHGLYETYDDDGEIDFKANYYYGDLHDDVYYYVGKKQDHQRKYNYGYIESYTYTDKDGKVVTKEMKDETANITTYWKNGKKAREFSINKGWFEGPYKKYYENGQLAEEQSYLNDLRHGIHKAYFFNGKLEFEGQYENGDQVGLYTSYYQTGQKRAEEHYAMGLLHGKSIYYNKDGSVNRTVTYFNGNVITIEKK